MSALHPISVDSRKKLPSTLNAAHPGAEILDVTSKGPLPWVRFSPFFPHGHIPVPGMPNGKASSVEGIWQGLKVFEGSGIDTDTLNNSSMRNIKRTVRKNGLPRGHQYQDRLLGYIEARKLIYLPAYKHVLDHFLQPELEQLRAIARQKPLVLLDYETNCDILNDRKPLSHAFLIKAYLEGNFDKLMGQQTPPSAPSQQKTLF